MTNIPESPDANEQGKSTPARARVTTRKAESAAPTGQDATTKAAAPRRSASTTASNTSSATRPARAARPAEQASAAPATQTPASRQATSNNTTAAPRPTRPVEQANAAPTPQANAAPAPQSSAPRPAAASPRPAATAATTARPATSGSRAPSSSQLAPASTQRTAYAPRPGSAPQTAQRSGGAPATPLRPRPLQPGQQGQGQHAPSGARPAPRPAGRGYSGGGRPSGRPGAPTQRPSERRASAVKEKPTGPVSIPAQIVVKDLASLLHATPNEVISDLIKKHSIFANINQVIDYDKAALVAQDLGFEPSQSESAVAPAIQQMRSGPLAAPVAEESSHVDEEMVVIPPVVTIMGHVDHGKTSLLDTIRKTKVAAGEVGGITQYIGAYQVEVQGKKITFLDTPGHEAFTAMRARGAQVTHIAIIVVAADDGVMPQTREAIDHAKAANVPIIIALNKMDKLDANPDFVKQQLAEIDVVVEDYGGDVICVPVSARKGTGIDDLLEMILLVAEIQDIRANPNLPATGTIIEARLEKSSGPTATVLIQNGTLKMGDNVLVGAMAGKVRAMFNDRGKRIQKAPPSTPVSLLGLPEVPQAGDHLEVVADERTARARAMKTAEQRRSDSRPLGQVSLDTLYTQMQEGSVKELNLVLKCDVQGSAEAIKNSLSKVGDENLKVRLIHEGIGNISETDVHLAGASGAIIIGFNVKADGAAQRLAQKESVDIRYYNIIYKLIDDIEAALTGMLEPTYREVIDGHAEIQQTFKVGKSTVIAGCRILDGKITRNSQARILRKKEKVWDGKIASLRRGKDDVREVTSGYECGIILEEFSDFEVGDIIEAYSQERVKVGA